VSKDERLHEKRANECRAQLEKQAELLAQARRRVKELSSAIRNYQGALMWGPRAKVHQRREELFGAIKKKG
jgi:hypothetical protein